MGQILRDMDYPAVRQLLDVSLDETMLPDEVLKLAVYTDMVEAEVRRRVPGWAAVLAAHGDNELYLRTAATCLLAAALAPRLVQLVSVQTNDTAALQYKRVAFDGVGMAARLQSQAEEALQLLPPEALPLPVSYTEQPQWFSVASGRRGALGRTRPDGPLGPRRWP